MSDTKRVNPKTFKEEKERNHLHRKVKRAKAENRSDEYYKALIETRFLERDERNN